MKKVNVRKITVTAILSAVATVLMFLNVPVPFMPSFIKLDFSELPALLAAFTMGPASGAAVCLVKNVVNLFIDGFETAGVGELSNFILGVAFVVPAGFIYGKWKIKKGAVAGSLVGAVTMALLSVATNFFITYPAYINLMGFPLEAILGMYHVINPIVGTEPNNMNLLTALVVFNVPFTFLKGMLSVIITFIIYKPLSPIIRGKRI